MLPKVKRFEDLLIWQKARLLTKLIYDASAHWPDPSLKDQIRRAAVSVISNIAEGFERGAKQEFLYFLYIARGSCGEVRAQLYIALDQNYLTKQQFDQLSDLADHTNRLIAKFITGYKQKGHLGQRHQTPANQEAEQFQQYLSDIVTGKIKT